MQILNQLKEAFKNVDIHFNDEDIFVLEEESKSELYSEIVQYSVSNGSDLINGSLRILKESNLYSSEIDGIWFTTCSLNQSILWAIEKILKTRKV